jgi:hypothetical protein
METSDFAGAAGYTRPCSKRKPFYNLVSWQGRDKGLDRGPGQRVAPVRGEVRQGPYDEGPAGQPRMGQNGSSRPSRADFPPKIQQIQIDQPGGVGSAPDAAEDLLYGMQLCQEPIGLQIR